MGIEAEVCARGIGSCRLGMGIQKFAVVVGIDQGSVLLPLLFSTVLDVLSEEGRKCASYELLYADNLVLIAKTMEELEV